VEIDKVKLEDVSPDELLRAAKLFYGDTAPNAAAMIDLGYRLAGPGGWKCVAPAWLTELRGRDQPEDNVE